MEAFELVATLRIQIHINNSCNKMFLDKIKFCPAILQDSTLPIVFTFCICSCLHCSNLHLHCLHKGKRRIDYSDHKTWPFDELHNKENW